MKIHFLPITIVIFITIFFVIPVFAKVHIVTTIPDFGSIAKEIGKEEVIVTSLARPTQDPHFVDAKPSFAIALNKANVLLVTGMELESGWLPPLLQNSRNPQIQDGASGYVDCSRFIIAKEVEAVNRAKGDIHPGGNPHYWTDPRNGILIAKGLGLVLSRVSPNKEKFFTQNTEDFISKLQTQMHEWKKKIEKAGPVNVVVYHESWTYFLDWAGMKQVGTLEPKPGIPPSPAHVMRLIQKVNQLKVKYILQESFYPSNLSRLFAQKTHAELKVLPTMVGAQNSTDYIDMIDKIVTEIFE